MSALKTALQRVIRSFRQRPDLRLDLTEVLSLLIACVAAWFLISGGGLLNTRGGGDSPFLLQRLHQMERALADGHFPVRWMPDANYGYGYPFYNFYAPLAFYVAAGFRLLRFSLVEAIQLSQLTAFLIAAWGMYRFVLGRFKQRSVALLASAAYTLAPFHLVNVYVRGDSIAEFWAMGFYPLTFLAVDSLFARLQALDDRKSAAGWSISVGLARWLRWGYGLLPLALAYAGLVVSHNISALIFSPFIGLYALFRLFESSPTGFRHRRRPIGEEAGENGSRVGFRLALSALVGALVSGLLLSAWFWLPAIGEQGLTQLSEITLGYFDYRYNDGFHFRSTDLVQPSFFFNPDVAGGRAFRMGLVQAILILLALLKAAVWLGRSRFRAASTPLEPELELELENEDGAFPSPADGEPAIGRTVLFLLGGLLLATLMLTPLSLPLWDRLPLLPYTQFPWRFLSVQAFFGAALTGFLSFPFSSSASAAKRTVGSPFSLLDHPNLRYVGTGLLLVLLLSANLGRIRPDYLPVADEDISGLALARYEWFTRNIGTTISAEYLAATMTPRPVTSGWVETGERNGVIVAAGDATVENRVRQTGREVWAISVTSPAADLVLPTMFWPGWVALVDGRPVDLTAATGSGLVQLRLPAGEHRLELALTRTPFRLWGERLSLFALLAVLVLFIGVWGRLPDVRFGPSSPPLMWAFLPLWGIGTLLLARLVAPPLPDAGLLTWDFGQMGYLHRAEQITYGHGAALTEYRYSTAAVARCETLEIELDWVDPPDGDVRQVTLDLVTPADNFYKDVPPLLSQNGPLEAGTVRYRFEIPPDVPSGLFVPLVRLSDLNRPRTLTGQKRGFLYLRPIEILPGCRSEPFFEAGLAEQTEGEGLSLIGQTVTHSPADPRVLDVDLVWQTGRPLSENLAVSLRLTDRIGREIHATLRDTEPGFGYRPTALWPVGEPVYDQLNIILPEEMPFEPPYYLLAKLYDPQSGETRLNRRLGRLDGELPTQLTFWPHQPDFALPTSAAHGGDEEDGIVAILGDQSGSLIELSAYEYRQIGEGDAAQIELTLYWRALSSMSTDYNHFVHLIDRTTGELAGQHDGLLDNNTFPTSQMVPGEVVADRVVLSLGGLPPGEYDLTTGLYFNDGQDFPRLVRPDGTGDVVPLQAVVVE